MVFGVLSSPSSIRSPLLCGRSCARVNRHTMNRDRMPRLRRSLAQQWNESVPNIITNKLLLFVGNTVPARFSERRVTAIGGRFWKIEPARTFRPRTRSLIVLDSLFVTGMVRNHFWRTTKKQLALPLSSQHIFNNVSQFNLIFLAPWCLPFFIPSFFFVPT